nr:MAG TPA: hypothetical protein [Caudoviricetes sp.]
MFYNHIVIATTQVFFVYSIFVFPSNIGYYTPVAYIVMTIVVLRYCGSYSIFVSVFCKEFCT